MIKKILQTILILIIPILVTTCKKPEMTGNIHGRITDAKSGQPISGASVQLDKVTTTSTSNGDGTYSFADLEPKTYTITVTKSGFVVNPQSVTVVVGQTQTADFQMETPSIILFPVTYQAQALTGVTNITVTSNTSWAAISSEPSWLTCTESGTGNGKISVNYTANISATSRAGIITLTATGLTPQFFTLTQSGVSPLHLQIKTLALSQITQLFR